LSVFGVTFFVMGFDLKMRDLANKVQGSKVYINQDSILNVPVDRTCTPKRIKYKTVPAQNIARIMWLFFALTLLSIGGIIGATFGSEGLLIAAITISALCSIAMIISLVLFFIKKPNELKLYREGKFTRDRFQFISDDLEEYLKELKGLFENTGSYKEVKNKQTKVKSFPAELESSQEDNVSQAHELAYVYSMINPRDNQEMLYSCISIKIVASTVVVESFIFADGPKGKYEASLNGVLFAADLRKIAKISTRTVLNTLNAPATMNV